MRWLMVVLGLVLGFPAQATILFASSEDTGFSAIGTVTGGASAGRYRAAFSRAFISPSSNTVTDPPVNRAAAAFTAGSNIWVHAYFYDLGTTGTLNEQSLILRSPDGVSRIVVRETGTYGMLKISQRNSAGTITDLVTSSSASFSGTTLTQFDLNVNYTAGGGVVLYINSVAVATFSGDPRTDSATQLNTLELANVSTSTTSWSEVIIADQDTRGMSLFTMAPQASGNTQSWTPNTLANINKAVINDATLISTSTNNALSEWTLPTAAPGGSWSVLAVTQDARVDVGASGPQHFDWLTRVGGTDYLAGVPAAPTASFANYNHIWPTNPGTSVAWTISDITAVGFNLGIESQP